MTIVIVQCRLGSTRLPRKALLPIGKKTLIQRVMESMAKIPADDYYLATDSSSYSELVTQANQCGWKCFVGSENDVLDRFCKLIQLTKADTVIRATGDNPFLFYEAAIDSLEKYRELKNCDYFTYSGLPHGSGIEIINAKTLITAATRTNLPYDHEHVAPSIYNHSEYTSVFETAPIKYFYPNYRTTVDTLEDYKHVLRLEQYLRKNYESDVYTYQMILQALSIKYLESPLLFIPSLVAGHGTGHLRRCISLCSDLCADIYIPNEHSLIQVNKIVEESGLEDWQIISEIDKLNSSKYSLCVIDYFKTDPSLLDKFSQNTPICSIDDGSPNTSTIDYLLDIIPSVDLKRECNNFDPSLIDLPQNVKKCKKKILKKVLVCLGGEDPANYSAIIASACNSLNLDVTIAGSSSSIPNLKESIYLFDLVITHYGFTAFEATAAGCAVILVGTSSLHEQLAKKYGFLLLNQNVLKSVNRIKNTIKKYLTLDDLIYPQKIYQMLTHTDSSFNQSLCISPLANSVSEIANGERISCPLCNNMTNPLIFRSKDRTYRRCSKCNLLYLSWHAIHKESYGDDYFNQEYKKQYGKTYIEDFPSILAQGHRRMSVINELSMNRDQCLKILDIGCAYGPFMKAAKECGWEPYGTDINENACKYVKDNLGFNTVVSSFPVINLEKLGVNSFDAVTMWYVIEHFKDLNAVLKKIQTLLPSGGIFAFSTPNGSGISGKSNKRSFLSKSPLDHYSIFELSKVKKLLAPYGLKVKRIVNTGHHPERFPVSKIIKNKVSQNIFTVISKICRLGDTFEVYCVRK